MRKKKYFEITTHSPQESEWIGSILGSFLCKGDVIALSGELGTGKTTLVKGIVHGLGGDAEEVASPSFTLLNEYKTPLPLYHIDLYRLSNEHDLLNIDFDDYLKGDGVVVIEWADNIIRAIPKDALWIKLTYQGEEARQIVFKGKGVRCAQIIEAVAATVYNKT